MGVIRRRDAPAADLEQPELVAHSLQPGPHMRLVPAPGARAWMGATPQRYANRCLPLLIANQSGWLVLAGDGVRATWDGTEGLGGVAIEQLGPGTAPVRSHFGSGIVTWNLPWLFRTPPGWNLLVRGPANLPKDAACALEGVVESDWSPATFTVNWKLTRAGAPVTWAPDEPIAMLVPQRRGELERFRPSVQSLLRAPRLARAHAAWSRSRQQFLCDLGRTDTEAQRRGWQRDYVAGTLPDGSRAPEHQTKLRLRSFDADEPR